MARALVVAGLLARDLMMAAPAAFAQAAEQPAPPPPATVVPARTGLDGQLASWLQVKGEFRARPERVTGAGFADNDDAYWESRVRLSARITPARAIEMAFQAADARVFAKAVGSQLAPLRDTLDVRIANVAFGSTTKLRLGRQELSFGEERLVGPAPWLNAGRSFDGARMTLARAGAQVDLLAVSVVSIRPDALDQSGGGNGLYGAYGAFKRWLPGQVVEPFFFWRQARTVVPPAGLTALHDATGGLRMAGPLPAHVEYSADVVVQYGSAGESAIRSSATHTTVGRRFVNRSGTPRIVGEFNYASGDHDPSDNRRETFDPLYPTPHDKTGLADQVGWRNIRHTRAGIEIVPAKDWRISASYHSWWLATTNDGLYSAGGARIVAPAAGRSGSHVGQELDVQTTYVYASQIQVTGGYAHIFPGAFLRAATPGHQYRYPFVVLSYVFIGPRPTTSG